MLKAISTPQDRSRTVLLLTVAVCFGVAAALVGLDDNPPGLLLAVLSATTCGVAVVHPWRSPQSFRRLAYSSIAGFLVSVFLHNALYAAASVPGVPALARELFSGASVLFFFGAILVFPPLFVVGVVGALVAVSRGRDA